MSLHNDIVELLQEYVNQNSFWKRLFSHPRNWFNSNVGHVRSVLEEMNNNPSDEKTLACIEQLLSSELVRNGNSRYQALIRTDIWTTLTSSVSKQSNMEENLVTKIIGLTRNWTFEKNFFANFLKTLLSNFTNESRQNILSKSLFHMMGDQSYIKVKIPESYVGSAVEKETYYRPVIENNNDNHVNTIIDYIKENPKISDLEKLKILSQVKNMIETEQSNFWWVSTPAKRKSYQSMTTLWNETRESVGSLQYPKNLQDLICAIQCYGESHIAKNLDNIDVVKIILDADFDLLLAQFLHNGTMKKLMNLFVKKVETGSDQEKMNNYVKLINKTGDKGDLFFEIRVKNDQKFLNVLKFLPGILQCDLIRSACAFKSSPTEVPVDSRQDNLIAEIVTLYHQLITQRPGTDDYQSHLVSLTGQQDPSDLLAFIEHKTEITDMLNQPEMLPLKNQIFLRALKTLTADCQKHYPNSMQQLKTWVSEIGLDQLTSVLSGKPVNLVAVEMLYTIAKDQNQPKSQTFMRAVLEACKENTQVADWALKNNLITKQVEKTRTAQYSLVDHSLFSPESPKQQQPKVEKMASSKYNP